MHEVDEWTGGRGGKGADSRADERARPTRRGQADGRKRCGRGPAGTAERTGKLGSRGWKRRGRADWADGHTGSLADGRTSGRRGGPGFKRPHSTRPISLLGAQSACLVRARVHRVPESAVGSKRILNRTLVLSAWTHLPHLSASVLGAEKGILLLGNKKWSQPGEMAEERQIDGKQLMHQGTMMEMGARKSPE